MGVVAGVGAELLLLHTLAQAMSWLMAVRADVAKIARVSLQDHVAVGAVAVVPLKPDLHPLPERLPVAVVAAVVAVARPGVLVVYPDVPQAQPTQLQIIAE